jgi:hypothetical protein
MQRGEALMVEVGSKKVDEIKQRRLNNLKNDSTSSASISSINPDKAEDEDKADTMINPDNPNNHRGVSLFISSKTLSESEIEEVEEELLRSFPLNTKF